MNIKTNESSNKELTERLGRGIDNNPMSDKNALLAEKVIDQYLGLEGLSFEEQGDRVKTELTIRAGVNHHLNMGRHYFQVCMPKPASVVFSEYSQSSVIGMTVPSALVAAVVVQCLYHHETKKVHSRNRLGLEVVNGRQVFFKVAKAG